jgi:hypothetical protein
LKHGKEKARKDGRVEREGDIPFPAPSSIRTCGFPAYGSPIKFVNGIHT